MLRNIVLNFFYYSMAAQVCTPYFKEGMVLFSLSLDKMALSVDFAAAALCSLRLGGCETGDHVAL